MAILPNKIKEEVEKQIPTEVKEGPQPITIEAYKKKFAIYFLFCQVEFDRLYYEGE